MDSKALVLSPAGLVGGFVLGVGGVATEEARSPVLAGLGDKAVGLVEQAAVVREAGEGAEAALTRGQGARDLGEAATLQGTTQAPLTLADEGVGPAHNSPLPMAARVLVSE